MFDYISVQQAAEKWGISERRIQKLCEEIALRARSGSATLGPSPRTRKSPLI